MLLFVVFFHLRKVARNLPRCAAAVDTTAAPRKFLCLRVYSLHCRPHSKEKQLFFYRGRDVILSGVAAKVCLYPGDDVSKNHLSRPCSFRGVGLLNNTLPCLLLYVGFLII